MTTEERIALLESDADGYFAVGNAGLAIMLELRALRLMLREELREAAWKVSPEARIMRDIERLPDA